VAARAGCGFKKNEERTRGTGGLSGCEREKAPPLAAAPPQVFVTTVEPRDVAIIEVWIGRLDGSADVDIRVCQAISRRSPSKKAQ